MSELVGILPHGDSEVNAISLSTTQPTAFATCDDGGHVTYWDTRMKRSTVLGVNLLEGGGGVDADILDLILDGEAMTVHTASSDGEISIVDLRKASVRAVHNLVVHDVDGKVVSGLGAMGFDSINGQHLSMRGLGDAGNRGFAGYAGSASHLGLDGVLLVADEEGGIHALDNNTLQPIPNGGVYSSISRPHSNPNLKTGKMALSGGGGGGSTSILGNSRGHSGSMCSGFTTALHAVEGGSTLGPLLWTVGMDGFLRTYGSCYPRASLDQLYAGDRLSAWSLGAASFNINNVDPTCIVSSWGASSSPSPLCSLDVGANIASGAIGNGSGSADAPQQTFCNPPIPGCMAPYLTQCEGDIPLLAIGRGDGTFAVLDCSTSFPAEDAVNGGGATLAYLTSGHERNAISALLWSRPACGGSGGDSASSRVVTKWLTSVAYSGEVSTFDMTNHVLPLDEDVNPEDESDAPLVFAGNSRDVNQTGRASSAGVNCAVAGSTSVGGDVSYFYIGTTHGEVIKVRMD